MFKTMLVEFNFEVETNTSSASISSFDLSQHSLVEKTLILLQQQNEMMLRWKAKLKLL